MSTVLQTKPATQDNLAEKLNFQQRLQAVTNKVHSTKNIDEIILELSQELCNLFNADRLTIYLLSEDKGSIISKVKTGLNSFKDIKLPINDQSIAGFVAGHKRTINIRDVYDDGELKSYSTYLNFLKAVDAKTGYRTKQMLVAPVLEGRTKELVGVIQIINCKSGQPFLPVMEEGVVQLAETLAIAFRQRQGPMLQVRTKYDALVTNAVISAEELELAQRSARRKSLDVETVLIDEFQVKLPTLGDALSGYFAVPYEPFKQDRIKPPDLLRNMNRNFCMANQWIPLEDSKDGIVVLALDPEKTRASRMVNNVYPKSRVVYRVTTNREFENTLDQMFGGSNFEDVGDIGDILGTLDDEMEVGDFSEDVASAANDNEVVKLVNKVIIDAYQQGASDIHVEPYPGKAKTEIRFRKDGMLVPYISVPGTYRAAIAARLKIMCDLDISERRKPQDGKIKFKKFGPLDIELRVATIPTQGGVEDIVMRILGGGEPIPMDKLGLSNRNLGLCKEIIDKPYGLFFVCGPTGSGKTTTLHSVLGYLNTPDTKIWTAEDPVEITQKGLRQVGMNPKAGVTFSIAMRAFLRADPDVIMVGEMRDKETVSTGIEASLTGHLVFATLHTNSAPESIVRLLDMGMDPFNFADALLGVLAQRLARRMCSCKEPHVASADEIQALLEEYSVEMQNTAEWKKDPKAARDKIFEKWVKEFGNDKGEITLYTAKGCDVCSNTGYKGRVGLHELLIGTDRIKKDIQEHARVANMFATAIEDGMRTLKQDGIEKVLQGITDVQQVRAVCIK
ncbi:MAG: ATPase, T2SS/T4P/T4SS family [Betaproteobacteria bacterium]|nr:ATPase, T2SS/T4P/T4SS family [Betaproteobacteria bacterium]